MRTDSVKIINSVDLTKIKSPIFPFRQYPTYMLSIIVKEPVKRMQKILSAINGCHSASSNLTHREQWGKDGEKKRILNSNYWRGWPAMHKINPINNREKKQTKVLFLFFQLCKYHNYEFTHAMAGICY